MVKRAFLAHAAVAALTILASSQIARADLLPGLTSTSPGAPGVTNFNYHVLVTEGERADGTSQTDRIQAYFTIYDISGFTGVVSTPTDWTFTVQNLGITPLSADNATPVGVSDNPGLANVTFSYTGVSSIIGPTTINDFIIGSTFSGIIIDEFSQQATRNVGFLIGTRDFGAGPLPVPFGQNESIVPEPSALLLMLTGVAAIVIGARRKRIV